MGTTMGVPAKILTIEDEPPIRDGIVAYLEDSGFTMLEANDGPTGLEIFRHEHPDVVLCDLRLPGMEWRSCPPLPPSHPRHR
jgi:CheY-like chemotaxis protein